jgi:arylsulfatase A-like enzyme
LPASNAPLRDGRGTLYEGGTRVPASVTWPRVVPAGTNDAVMHVVDMFPTLAAAAGAEPAKGKPLDGVDMWPTIIDGAPSKRTEVVYNVDPLAGAVREGDWKLVWKASLPPKIELFDLATDPGEAKNVADAHPDQVAALQSRIQALAAEMTPPLLINEAIRLTFYGPPISGDPSVLFSADD